MSIRKVFTEIKTHCRFYPIDGVNIEHCKDCNFFNGYTKEDDEITGVDCLRSDIGSLNAHVTSFTSRGYLYKSRYYDKNKDGKIEGDDPYDFCQKCCFNKTLENGEDICLLRCSVNEGEISSFTCYEGEIWEKERIEEDDEF